ncbi:Uncharacterised protein [Shigella sonnei]|nr:Uncharacterised protein [Shigella sonnei]
MVCLTEKCRQIRGQRIDKRLPLTAVLIRFQQVQIMTEIRQSQRTQTTNQSVVNHVAFMVSQNDPGSLIDQLTYPPKMRVGKRQALGHL